VVSGEAQAKYATAQTGSDHPVTVVPALLDHRRRITPLRPSAKRPRGGLLYVDFGGMMNLVPEPNTNQIREALEFSRFRFKLIEFLKLRPDIGELALRRVLERDCRGVYGNYLARAERVDDILKSEDTLEMHVRIPSVMDHGRSDSPNG